MALKLEIVYKLFLTQVLFVLSIGLSAQIVTDTVTIFDSKYNSIEIGFGINYYILNNSDWILYNSKKLSKEEVLTRYVSFYGESYYDNEILIDPSVSFCVKFDDKEFLFSELPIQYRMVDVNLNQSLIVDWVKEMNWLGGNSKVSILIEKNDNSVISYSQDIDFMPHKIENISISEVEKMTIKLINQFNEKLQLTFCFK